MGLDWIVGARPAPGHEEDGWIALREALATPQNESLVARWLAVPKIDSWHALDAPVVGQSEAADEWMLGELRRRSGVPDWPPRPATPRELEGLAQMRGFAVVALAPPSDGLPLYSNAEVNPELERSSFRGQFLADLVPHFGAALFEEAHHNMLPEALLAFGKRLEALARKHAVAHGLEVMLEQRAFPDAEPRNEHADVVHLTASAARWCSFWATRGHWLNTSW